MLEGEKEMKKKIIIQGADKYARLLKFKRNIFSIM